MSKPICYLNPKKGGAREVLEAFAAGSGAEIRTDLVLQPGRAAVLYGVDPTTEPLYRRIVAEGHPYYYIDNGYFRSKWSGGDYYRVTRDRPQHGGGGTSDGKRWAALGLNIKPWRQGGTHILIACQSDYWYQRHGQINAKAWAAQVLADLKARTQRPVLVRGKELAGKKDQLIADAFKDCWAVVVHSSNVAVDALLEGIPVFCSHPCAAYALSGGVQDIERPMYSEQRERWAAVLADNQWTIEEIRCGSCWAALNSHRELS